MSHFSSTGESSPVAKGKALFPKREYNVLLKPNFYSKEEESLWFHLSRSFYGVKPIVCSLAPHKPTLAGLHAITEVYDLFENVELDIDLVMGRPTHKELTYQFVTSFKVVHDGARFGENSVWEFRIQNTDFTWTRGHAKTFLDFPRAGECDIPTEEEAANFWREITGLSEFGKDESPFSIHSIHWQFIHRLVATNINCQPDSSDRVTMEDLELMWAISIGAPIDWFQVFANRFLSMKDLHGSRQFVGCTSLITLIAECCGFEFSCPPYENRALDHAHWKKLGIIARPLPDRPPTAVNAGNSESQEEEDPSEEPDEMEQEEEDPRAKKQKIDIDIDGGLNEKIDWTKVRKVTVYEF